MARRKRVYRKIERRDPRYDSTLVGKLISKVMLDGKRSLAERIVYAAIDMANEGTDSIDPLEVITRAIENAKPRVEVKSRRVGGATYQVPLEVDPARSESLAMRWIVNYARNRKGVPMHKALSNEIKEAANNQGAAVRKRDDVHKMAQANRAFATSLVIPFATVSRIIHFRSLQIFPRHYVRSRKQSQSQGSS